MNRKLTPLQQIVALVLFFVIAFLVGDQMWKAVDPTEHREFWGGNEEGIIPEVQATEDSEALADQEDQRVYSGLVCKDADHDTYCSLREEPFVGVTITAIFTDGDEMTFVPLGDDGRWILGTNRKVEEVIVIVPDDCESTTFWTLSGDGSYYANTAVYCLEATPTATPDPVPEWERLSPYADPLAYEGQTVTILRYWFSEDVWDYIAMLETDGGVVEVQAAIVNVTSWGQIDGMTYRSDYSETPVTGSLIVYTNQDPEYDFLENGERAIDIAPPSPEPTEKDKVVDAAWGSFLRQIQSKANLVSRDPIEYQWYTLYGDPYLRCDQMGIAAHEMPWIRGGVPEFCVRPPIEFGLTSLPSGFHYSFYQPVAYRMLTCGARSSEYVLTAAGISDYELWGGLTYKYPYALGFHNQKTGEDAEIHIPGGGYLAVLDPYYAGWTDTPPEAWEWFYVPTDINCN